VLLNFWASKPLRNSPQLEPASLPLILHPAQPSGCVSTLPSSRKEGQLSLFEACEPVRTQETSMAQRESAKAANQS
jgi:hypothetical protein